MKDFRTLRRFAVALDFDGGAFAIPHDKTNVMLKVVASNGGGWDHVSVSLSHRCPNWPEMSYIKDLFFYDFETVMQLHVPTPDHVNYHPNCLHLWRPQDPKIQIPRPPSFMVGPKQ